MNTHIIAFNGDISCYLSFILGTFYQFHWVLNKGKHKQFSAEEIRCVFDDI